MLASNFKFSVVIPSFNDLRILDTIESINSQSIERSQIEIVIMDAGSNPDVLEKIAESLLQSDQFQLPVQHFAYRPDHDYRQ